MAPALPLTAPRRVRRELLILAIAWKLQEKGHGGLTPAQKRTLAGLVEPLRSLPSTDVVRAKSKRETSLGKYRPALKGDPPSIITDATPGNALHEYVHHLQATMPGFDSLFQNLHKQRNRGLARAPLDNYRGFGRTDEYIDDYFGAEYRADMLEGLGYDPDSPALEVITRAFQITFHEVDVYRSDGAREVLNIASLSRDDPEMLDLVLGVLFHHIP